MSIMNTGSGQPSTYQDSGRSGPAPIFARKKQRLPLSVHPNNTQSSQSQGFQQQTLKNTQYNKTCLGQGSVQSSSWQGSNSSMDRQAQWQVNQQSMPSGPDQMSWQGNNPAGSQYPGMQYKPNSIICQDGMNGNMPGNNQMCRSQMNQMSGNQNNKSMQNTRPTQMISQNTMSGPQNAGHVMQNKMTGYGNAPHNGRNQIINQQSQLSGGNSQMSYSGNNTFSMTQPSMMNRPGGVGGGDFHNKPTNMFNQFVPQTGCVQNNMGMPGNQYENNQPMPGNITGYNPAQPFTQPSQPLTGYNPAQPFTQPSQPLLMAHTPQNYNWTGMEHSQRQHNPTQHAQLTNTQTATQQGTSSSSASNKTEFQVKKRATQDVRRTLHFLSATIEGMKHWNQYRTKTALMYEIVAKLNSAVLGDDNGISREFVLQDCSQSINTVFYEIDCELPKLTRGFTYRCVGSLEPRSGRFRCVSIRPCTEEEKSVHAALVKVSDRTMREIAAKQNEL